MAVVTKTSFARIAGHVALDFTNTVTWRQRGLDRERLRSFADLLEWSRQAGTLDAAAFGSLQKAARARPQAAMAAHRAAMRARAELHALFVAQATGHRAPAAVVSAINRRTRRAMAHLVLQSRADRVTVGWDPAVRFDRPLWPILQATLDLLTSSECALLRVCANPDCGWLFLDQSRKRNRRWCSMRECGSRAKARAYYQRRRRLDDTP